MSAALNYLLVALGIIGGVLFYGRFYVQWYVSERQKKSVMPVAFWYMSSVGSVLLFAEAYNKTNPGGTFGLCFNIVVYARNLVHIWRERGQLTRLRSIGIHLLAAVIAVTAVTLTALTWQKGFSNTRQFWVWTAIWGAGQAFFFLRFFIQWLVSEIKKKSVVPPVFWHFSLAASLFQTVYFFHQQDWVLAIGMVATIPIYMRNLWFIYFTQNEKNAAQETA